MIKTVFDYLIAILLLPVIILPLITLIILAKIINGGSGIFKQTRIGKDFRPFEIYKIKTYHQETNKIHKLSHYLRKYKLDELLQIINILKGEMSFVGPRPDVKHYIDLLSGEEKKIMALKPGITSPASLKYFNEEHILKSKKEPQKYYDEVIFRDKVKLNLEYYYNRSTLLDFKILYLTLITLFRRYAA